MFAPLCFHYHRSGCLKDTESTAKFPVRKSSSGRWRRARKLCVISTEAPLSGDVTFFIVWPLYSWDIHCGVNISDVRRKPLHRESITFQETMLKKNHVFEQLFTYNLGCAYELFHAVCQREQHSYMKNVHGNAKQNWKWVLNQNVALGPAV